jgi:hypothetical protein
MPAEPATLATIPHIFILQEAIMQEVMDWIDKEATRLNFIIEGKAVDTPPESIPEVLKDALYDCIGF